jgi:two-component system, cell cycle sensor histidine kinase and response regulator CckA
MMNTANECKQSPQISDERLSKTSKAGAETIMVVEDEPDLLELVVQVLEGRGYTVLGAASGKQALEQWSKRDHDIDLLLTDMTMPDGMTGCQLAERLRTDAPNLRVIYSSGHTAGVPGTQLAHVEDHQFLAKPYRPSKLLEVVRNCLDGTASPTNGGQQAAA